jgi:hypothetical protein
MGKNRYDGGMHPKDMEVLKCAQTGEGAIPITSAEMLNDLVKTTRATKNVFSKTTETMTKKQAEKVREWRVNDDCTWRGIAQMAWNEGWFDRRWDPPSNQLMGMDLCEKAARFFGENYMEPPWN